MHTHICSRNVFASDLDFLYYVRAYEDAHLVSSIQFDMLIGAKFYVNMSIKYEKCTKRRQRAQNDVN